MSNEKFIKDLKAASEIVWIILSVLILSVLFVTVFFPDMLLSLSPVCLSKSLYGQECFMCGMTRAFADIAGGNFTGAADLNRSSIFLFSAFVLNTAVFIFYLLKKFKSHFNKKRSVTEIQNKKLFQN